MAIRTSARRARLHVARDDGYLRRRRDWTLRRSLRLPHSLIRHGFRGINSSSTAVARIVFSSRYTLATVDGPGRPAATIDEYHRRTAIGVIVPSSRSPRVGRMWVRSSLSYSSRVRGRTLRWTSQQLGVVAQRHPTVSWIDPGPTLFVHGREQDAFRPARAPAKDPSEMCLAAPTGRRACHEPERFWRTDPLRGVRRRRCDPVRTPHQTKSWRWPPRHSAPFVTVRRGLQRLATVASHTHLPASLREHRGHGKGAGLSSKLAMRVRFPSPAPAISPGQSL